MYFEHNQYVSCLVVTGYSDMIYINRSLHGVNMSAT